MSTPHLAKAATPIVSRCAHSYVLECTSLSNNHFIYFEDEHTPTTEEDSMHGTYYIGNTINSTLVFSKADSLSGHNHLNFYPSNNTSPTSLQFDADQSYQGCTLIHRDNAD